MTESAVVGRVAAVPSIPSERLALLFKVAHMYHVEGLRQPDIATRLHVTQSKVSRLLKEAVGLGVVRTVVVTPPGVFAELEYALRERHGLRDVVIAGTQSDDEASVLGAIGAAGAAYVESTLLPGDRIGISSRSLSLLAVVEAMAPVPARSAEIVVQILGAIGNPAVQVQATRLTDRLAELTGAEPVYLVAPGVVASLEVRDGLLADPYISRAVAAWEELTTVLVGVGSMSTSPLRTSSGPAFPSVDLETLAAGGAVGDVCLNFFDHDGEPVHSGLHDRVLGISADLLRQVPRRIGVGGGPLKVDAIRGAIRGGWIDVLVTDQHTARRLLA
ncbi:sugar-binding transcriptional regulator [Jiangella endophytica]|uniref:sugar-binding transcriptional regulator n=1 Tax=Jiangella endophytica TaxID=1623398 RepID=UPI0018E4E94E|nr:sugar-binding domain-containing protein [Jiangella endophytica]